MILILGIVALKISLKLLLHLEINFSMKKSFEFLLIPLVLVSLLLVPLIIFVLNHNPQEEGLYADGSTHLLQAISIAFDSDVEYDPEDVKIYYQDGWKTIPYSLFLNEHNGIYYYSKPVLYPLFSSIFVRVFYSKGLLIWNAFAVFGILILLAIEYKKNTSLTKSVLFASVFLFASPIVYYLRSIHPDITIAFLITFAAFFYIRFFNTRRLEIKYLVISAFFLGLSLYEKPPLITFFIVFLFSLILGKLQLVYKIRQTLLFAVIVCVFYLIPTIVIGMSTGSLISYQGNRWFFPSPPYTQAEVIAREIKTANIFNPSYILNNVPTGIYNLKFNFPYFFIGRQTSLIFYFPLSIVAIFLIYINRKLLRQPKITLIIGLLLYVMFYLTIFSNNYYGGETAFGNRYFLQVYPVLLLAIPSNKLKNRTYKLLLLVMGYLGIILYLSLITNSEISIKNRHNFISTSNLVEVLPIEKTLVPAGYPIGEGVSIYFYSTHRRDDDSFILLGDNSHEFIIRSEIELNDYSLRFGFKFLESNIIARVHTGRNTYQLNPDDESFDILLNNPTRIFFGGLDWDKKRVHYIYTYSITIKDSTQLVDDNDPVMIIDNLEII